MRCAPRTCLRLSLAGRRIGQGGGRRSATKLQRAYSGRQVRQNADAQAHAGGALHTYTSAYDVQQLMKKKGIAKSIYLCADPGAPSTQIVVRYCCVVSLFLRSRTSGARDRPNGLIWQTKTQRSGTPRGHKKRTWPPRCNTKCLGWGTSTQRSNVERRRTRSDEILSGIMFIVFVGKGTTLVAK